MTIQYASDLHLEFQQNTKWLTEHPLQVAGDVLVLAGDIILLGEEALKQHPFFDWCSSNYRLTLIVPGNHEYYKGAPALDDTLRDYDLPLRHNVHYCNNHSVTLGDTQIFLTTMWSRISPENIDCVQAGMTDFYRIIYDGDLLLAQDCATVHRRCLRWLDAALQASTARHKVVVTHHCPMMVEDPKYKPNGLTEAFVVDMSDFIQNHSIDHWIYGHTHYNAGDGMQLGSTTMHCNQLGYVRYGAVPGYTPAATITV